MPVGAAPGQPWASSRKTNTVADDGLAPPSCWVLGFGSASRAPGARLWHQLGEESRELADVRLAYYTQRANEDRPRRTGQGEEGGFLDPLPSVFTGAVEAPSSMSRSNFLIGTPSHQQEPIVHARLLGRRHWLLCGQLARVLSSLRHVVERYPATVESASNPGTWIVSRWVQGCRRSCPIVEKARSHEKHQDPDDGLQLSK